MKKLALMLLIVTGCGSYQRPPIIGPRGEPGLPGSDGKSAVINVTAIPNANVLPSSVCAAGGFEYRSATDLNENGQAEVGETNYSVSIVCNGVNGQDGTDGQDAPPTPYTMVGMVDPCGKQGTTSAPDEVFILLANGQLIASFSLNQAGNYTRFSSLIPNANSSFGGATTDQTGCGITISRDNANQVTLTTSNGVGNMSWTLNP